MWPLYGGGYGVALAQVVVVYYSAAVLLHYVVPALLPTKSVQKGVPKPGQVSREAVASLCEWAPPSLRLQQGGGGGGLSGRALHARASCRLTCSPPYCHPAADLQGRCS